MRKKQPNFKGWKNVFNVLIAKPAKKAGKRAAAHAGKKLRKAIGLKPAKAKRK